MHETEVIAILTAVHIEHRNKHYMAPESQALITRYLQHTRPGASPGARNTSTTLLWLPLCWVESGAENGVQKLLLEVKVAAFRRLLLTL